MHRDELFRGTAEIGEYAQWRMWDRRYAERGPLGGLGRDVCNTAVTIDLLISSPQSTTKRALP